ncbi:MAG: TonB-dependent receptor domain-containing protein [Muribaculaceae bacterium]
MSIVKICVLCVAMMSCIAVRAQQIKGIVTDASTGETIVGAVATLRGDVEKTTASDVDGSFEFKGLDAKRQYELQVQYLGYKVFTLRNVKATSDRSTVLQVKLEPDKQALKEVTVTGVERRGTQASMIRVAKNSDVIVNNVSAQMISTTQDSNAGEVIRRVPGVSIIDEKFVMVRGLSQRYNNVWVNGGAVPSSEADARAFSFDIIPSSQIENITIVKTASAEYPADYSGGFVIVGTKDIPASDGFSIGVGGNVNDATCFKQFLYSQGSGTDFLGFDSGKRSLKGGMDAAIKPILDAAGNAPANNAVDLLGNGFNNDWMVKNRKPVSDLKLVANVGKTWNINGNKLGLLSTVNYANEYRTYNNMQNNLFGIYDAVNDKSNYLRHSLDNQYNNNVRLGAMLNLTLLSSDGNHNIQLKNIFNQLGNNRYTWREGVSAQSNNERSAEYYYRSRTTYITQLSGKHTLSRDNLDWSAGYAYANRHMPDRRRWLMDDAIETGVYALSTGNDVSREWTRLDEHIGFASVNNKRCFDLGFGNLQVKAGAYGEYRNRKYVTRNFIYNWNVGNNNLPADFRYGDIAALLSNEQNMGADKLYMLEEMQMRNNYRGYDALGAGYVNVLMPLGNVSLLAGVRYEYNDMALISNTRDYELSERTTHYRHHDVFPSVNVTYRFDDKHQMRLCYGRSVNRPEFREVSPSVYYDFDLASNVQGNTELKNCYVNNVDLRYELYPSAGESVSVALFGKFFSNPIEWTYTVAGGTDLIYSYKNARSATSYGVELDVRKNLGFIGLQNFDLSLNGAVIKSDVKFEEGAKEENRPMQGQSPYLVNVGMFYKCEPLKLNVAVLYNVIGKRIIGVGRSEGTTGSDDNARVPHSYEMPRNLIDLSVTKQFGKHFELKLNVRDLLAQDVMYKQFAKVTYADGTQRQVEQVSRSYNPGRNIGLQLVYSF